LSVVGYLLMYTSSYVPQLSYVACVLIGFGFIPCQLQPLLGVIMMKSYPSKLIAPSIITIALVTVVIQSGIVELFRSMPNQLCLVYLIIMVLLAVTYLQIEPFLIYAMRRKLPDSEKAEEASAPEAAGKSDELNTDADPIATLTKREREVLELIGSGYSNGDIAKVLFISEHTVNDYTKKIYRKLDVHSRHAAAVIINQYKQ